MKLGEEVPWGWAITCDGASSSRFSAAQRLVAILNLLAFAFHAVAELTHDLRLQAINKAGARRRFFEHLRA